jgi:hypothetical protein
MKNPIINKKYNILIISIQINIQNAFLNKMLFPIYKYISFIN